MIEIIIVELNPKITTKNIINIIQYNIVNEMRKIN